MRSRFLVSLFPKSLISRPSLLMVGAVIGFVVIVASQLHPPDPESRLPGQYRLAALIQRQQHDNDQQKAVVDGLRSEIDQERKSANNQRADIAGQTDRLNAVGLQAGTVAMSGQGFTVTLDDSTLSASPTGNVNDLVIHSQDVQAVVNAMWQAGAEAISINGQRVVATSAILCVGNTLLLNGTVHAPPYEVSAVGPDRSRFEDDSQVKQLHSDAERFSLRFSTTGDKNIDIPAYNGPTVPKYAQAVN